MKKTNRFLFCLFLIMGITIQTLSAQQIVRYDLYVRDTLVNFTGKNKRAIAVNGQIPMPTLNFTQGDIAEIYVHNEMDEETSLHWHGLFLPNQEDGVPYLTQMPIKPHSTHKYTFPIIQNGTHWYHSHSGFQEQIGMYGSFVIHKKESEKPQGEVTSFRKGIDDLPTLPIILSEWTDTKPHQIHRMLHNASDWFAIQKGTTQSYAEAIKEGHFFTKLTNEWKRMLAMDVSDVYYNKVLINGKETQNFSFFQATQQKGKKIRLRISNAGASTYFWLTYAGGKITIVATDGNDVEPIEVDRLIIAVAETYDVIITLNENEKSYEFLATSEDRTNSASLFLGKGEKKTALPLPRLKYFEGMKMMNEMMKINGKLNDNGMKMSLNQMDMNTVMYPEITGNYSKSSKNPLKEDSDNSNKFLDIVTLNYSLLKSPTKTTLPVHSLKNGIKELHFELSGNMNRYVWSMNNKVLSEADKILVKKGEILRISLYNNSMMRHPMHLHGHDFRVLNQFGEYSPLKNTLDIMPMETDIIEFEANAEGDWFFHCHILYHMMAGMGRVISYENQTKNPLIEDTIRAKKKLFSDDRKFHSMIENDFATNGNDGMIMFSNTRWNLSTEWRLGYNKMHGYEVETHLGRYIGAMQWFMPFIGFDWRYRKMGIDEHNSNWFKQTNSKDNRTLFSLGFIYTLPMLISLQTEVYHDGTLRIQFMREDIAISKRIRANFMFNSDREYMLGLKYIGTKNVSISTHYDSDMGIGIGINLNY